MEIKCLIPRRETVAVLLQLLVSVAMALAFNLCWSQDRFALVVGNANYEKASTLDNTTNDAADLAARLQTLGFNVTLRQNIRTRAEFRDVVRGYHGQLAAGKDSVGLFFYAGHAVQVDGENYLIPTAADIRDQPDLEEETLSLGYVTAMAGDAGNPVNLFFIDACRDNPFRGFSRALNRGLAASDTPEGSIIVYAASPGKVASDGSGRNSPFTANLLKQIDSDEHVLLMLQNVVKGVRNDTGGQQQPWFHASLTGDFYFAADGVTADTVSDSEPGAAATEVAAIKPAETTSVSTAKDDVKTSVETRATANAAPAMSQQDTTQGNLAGRWSGSFKDEAGGSATVTMNISSAVDGYYQVDISRLISYGELPASCSFAKGRLQQLTDSTIKFQLEHSGCNGGGNMVLQQGSISGDIAINNRKLRLELRR